MIAKSCNMSIWCIFGSEFSHNIITFKVLNTVDQNTRNFPAITKHAQDKRKSAMVSGKRETMTVTTKAMEDLKQRASLAQNLEKEKKRAEKEKKKAQDDVQKLSTEYTEVQKRNEDLAAELALLKATRAQESALLKHSAPAAPETGKFLHVTL